jgi:hypothetical protein
VIFHIEVLQLSRGKFSFRPQELHPVILEFLQDRGDLPPQFKDYESLLDINFLTDITATHVT